MTQFEFYKSFLFVAELMVAELLFLTRKNKRSFFVWRLILSVVVVCGLAYLLPAGSNNPFWCAFLFAAIFGLTVLAGKFMFDETWFTILFCAFAGYTVQHFSYELYNVFLVLFKSSSSSGFYGSSTFTDIFPNLFVFALYLSVYVLCYFLGYIFFATKIEKSRQIKLQKDFVFVFAVVVFAVDILLNAFVVYDSDEKLVKYSLIISIYNVLCCVISLYLQFEVATRRQVESEFDSMREIWKLQKKQYEMSKQNIEIINMKCHDLKHHIHSIGDGAIGKDALCELEEHISIYDSSAKTGNDALDVILTEKSLLCNKEKINFGYIVDGERLNFMKKEDIYALFGNIIDNAIEAVLKLEEAKRVISLKVKASGKMLVVNAFNYFDGALNIENGEIKTVKHDKAYHGFGLKSIKYISQRYNGDFQITAENGVFTLTIIFPFAIES
ncbi:MAG TPA: hypothetical protein DDY77_03980 [Clostridiales bacterium]|nr:hypothetical protein [Clostridiales bacterium]